MDKNDERRVEIEAADDTGMVANQEFYATFPAEELHRTLPQSHTAHRTIDQLQTELGKDSPSRSTITEHAGALLGIRELEATVANWWDHPITQRFIYNLTEIGL